MQRRSPVLEALAREYAKSTAGQTGEAARDYSIRLLRLLKAADCERGERYEVALADLQASDGHALVLERDRRSHDIRMVKVPLRFEAALFARIGQSSPTAEREAWAALFESAKEFSVPGQHAQAWAAFCERRAAAARRGEGWTPFRKDRRQRARIQLEVLARLLAWRGEALLRTVSVRVAGSSKYLERCRSAMESLLAEATAGTVTSLAQLGIAENPRTVTFHGPVRVRIRGIWTDYSAQASATLSEDDLLGAEIECDAPRCVTVENATKFHELARLRCGDLFVLTSYPNRATSEFLRRLPASLPRFHFGDTDPWGFDVLRSLRSTVGLPIAPLHMTYRENPASAPFSARDRKKLERLLHDPLLEDVWPQLERLSAAGRKGDFEQESLVVRGAFPYC